MVGEVLPATQIERVLRDYYAGKLGDADLEDRLLRDVEEEHFRAICQNALEGLATKKLNLEMLIERRARAQERRVVPEAIARFLNEAADYVPLAFKPVAKLAPHFRPASHAHRPAPLRVGPGLEAAQAVGEIPQVLDRPETAEHNNLEWITPGHPLFESIRRHTLGLARGEFGKGACYYSLAHDRPARLDFFRARVVDGLGKRSTNGSLPRK